MLQQSRRVRYHYALYYEGAGSAGVWIVSKGKSLWNANPETVYFHLLQNGTARTTSHPKPGRSTPPSSCGGRPCRSPCPAPSRNDWLSLDGYNICNNTAACAGYVVAYGCALFARRLYDLLLFKKLYICRVASWFCYKRFRRGRHHKLAWAKASGTSLATCADRISADMPTSSNAFVITDKRGKSRGLSERPAVVIAC